MIVRDIDHSPDLQNHKFSKQFSTPFQLFLVIYLRFFSWHYLFIAAMPKEKSVNPAQAQRKAEKAKAIKKSTQATIQFSNIAI